MKILIISNSYWNLFNFRKNLIDSILDRGDNVILVAQKDKYFEKFKNLKTKNYSAKVPSRKVAIFKDLIYIIRLYKIISKEKPDILITFTIKPNIYVSLISRIIKIKVINNITGLGSSFLNNKLFKNFTFFLYKISISSSKIVLFQNKYDRDLFLKLNIVKIKNSDVIPGSGVNTNFFKSKNIDSLKNNVFLFSGRLLKDKGIFDYLEAALILLKKNKNLEFHIIGDFENNEKSSLVRKIINQYLSLNVNIKYLGFVEDPRIYYEKSSCIILPSYREGLSKSLSEAASMSKPIITYDVPGCSDIVINNFNGYLAETKNVDSLVKTINKFIETDYETRIKMGKNSRKIIKNKFSSKIIISKYLEKINSLV